jgi:hypothetical protein
MLVSNERYALELAELVKKMLRIADHGRSLPEWDRRSQNDDPDRKGEDHDCANEEFELFGSLFCHVRSVRTRKIRRRQLPRAQNMRHGK